MSELTLNYIAPTNNVVVTALLKPVGVGYDDWLDAAVKGNPDVIFFYTVATTDIFDTMEF